MFAPLALTKTLAISGAVVSGVLVVPVLCRLLLPPWQMRRTLLLAAAGLAGGLFAQSKGSVFPTYVHVGHSVDALLTVLLGGIATLSGPIIGGLVYTGLYDWLLQAVPMWRLALGAAIVALVLAFPDGIAGAAIRLGRRR